MSMTPNASEMLKAFVEAGNALEELPKVRADLDAAQALASETEALLNAERAAKALALTELATLRAALASKEAELSAATFRHSELAKVVDSVRALLPSLAPSVDPAPRNEPAPAVAPAQPTEAETSNENPTPVANTSATTFTPLDNANSNGAEVATVAENTQVSTNPAPEPEVSATGPNPSSTSTPEAHGEVTSTHGPDTDVGEAKVSGEPYWRKPTDMPWHVWASRGGDVPYWITDHNAA